MNSQPIQPGPVRPFFSASNVGQDAAGLSKSFDSAVAAPVLSDAELEAHIESLGALMLAAYARYEQHGCFGDRGEADRYRRERDAAIATRSAAQVHRMEVERGLASA